MEEEWVWAWVEALVAKRLSLRSKAYSVDKRKSS